MSDPERWYEQATAEFGPALARLARGYEADAEKRRDLMQEIHMALWRSFRTFGRQCSLRTWVYRVAHNTATGWAMREKRLKSETLVGLDEMESVAVEAGAERGITLERLTGLIRRLKPPDRQIILLYLEGMDAAEIGELAGISASNAATKVHRIKALLARDFNAGVGNAR